MAGPFAIGAFRPPRSPSLAIGIVLAALASRLMTALLYGFRPDYIMTVVVVAVILLAVAAGIASLR